MPPRLPAGRTLRRDRAPAALPGRHGGRQAWTPGPRRRTGARCSRPPRPRGTAPGGGVPRSPGAAAASLTDLAFGGRAAVRSVVRSGRAQSGVTGPGGSPHRDLRVLLRVVARIVGSSGPRTVAPLAEGRHLRLHPPIAQPERPRDQGQVLLRLPPAAERAESVRPIWSGLFFSARLGASLPRHTSRSDVCSAGRAANSSGRRRPAARARYPSSPALRWRVKSV